MRDNDDALFSSLRENALQRLRGVGNHRDGRWLLGDQILDNLHLLLRTDIVSPFLACIDASALSEGFDTLLHALEPRDGLRLDDRHHHHVATARAIRGLTRAGRRLADGATPGERQRQAGD